jgi:putative ABC transport system ATP-binding protein
MTSPADTAPAIDIQDLRFGWQRDRIVLDMPRLQVSRADRLFLQGPSGSGKSTLLGLLGGVLVPAQGTVHVLGTDLATLSGAGRDRYRADHIGIIFQQFNLLPFLDVASNVVLPCRFSPRRAQQAKDPAAEAMRLLQALGLDAEQLRRCPARELSVGQQQRVAAARALIGAPEILIADEPTSALDADARAVFLRLLFAECERAGTTLLFVSHDSSLAPLFTRTLSLTEINRATTGQLA